MIHSPLQHRSVLLLLLFILLPASLHAQALRGRVAWNWYFGWGAGLSFANGTPDTLLGGRLTALDGSASISDRRTGTILFYTDGTDVWNRLHQPMMNGAGLLGHRGSTQSSLIVPVPGDDSLYYIFTSGAGAYVAPEADNNGIRYSVVDLRMDGGLGAVDPRRKNVMLLTPAAEKLTATRHCNGRDYWVLAHEWGTNRFVAWRLTPDGITDTVPSSIGTIHTRDPGRLVETGTNCSGAMKLSADGKRLAVASTGLQLLEVFDFDNSSGVVSNPIDLGSADPDEFYGISFSPDNSKLYATTVNPALRPDRLLQFDLAAGDAAAIRSSMYVVASAAPGTLGSIQVGPDGKLYVTYRGSGIIGAMKAPDMAGVDCDYDSDAIDFKANITGQGLPNFIDCDVIGVSDLQLRITNDASSTSLRVGDLVTFTIRVCNDHKCVISNVLIHDTLPPGFEYVDGMSDYPRHTFDSIVGNGGCRSIFLRARVTSAAARQTPITDCATIIGSSPERGGNDIDSACADVMVIEPTIPETDVGVRCVADVAAPERGAGVRYTIDLFTSGPQPASQVVARDVLPVGVQYVGHRTDRTDMMYDPATGDITVQLLNVGDTATLTIDCLVDSSGAGDIENCVQLLATQPMDNNAANDRSCATISPRWCNAPEVTARVYIPQNLSTSYERELLVPVILDDSLDAARVTRVRITLEYDSTIARPGYPTDLSDPSYWTEQTLLKGWQIIAIDSTHGRLVIELAAPHAAGFIHGTGLLLQLPLRMYLGRHHTTELPLTVEFPGNPCAAAVATAGRARLDSLCGLQFRLFEMTGATKLGSVSPNPFNPSTDISFSLGMSGEIRLDVMNAQGEIVAVLVDGTMAAGDHVVRWDAGMMPSGVYYCRLQNGSTVLMMPMLLVR